MNFIEAIEAAKEGKKIRSVMWPGDRFIYIDNEDEEEDYWWFDEQGDHAFFPEYEKLIAPWAIYEEDKSRNTYSWDSFKEARKRLEKEEI